MPASSKPGSVIERQLLLQLGERLKAARKKQGITTTELAERAGISRMTLRAVEAGESSATMGSFLRVMSALGVAHDLALLASEALRPPGDPRPADSGSPALSVAGGDARHELQDLQSMALHEEAVRLIQKQPELIQQALETLEHWRASGNSQSRFLWDEWSVILHRRAWRRALANTRRSKELRQASPLPTVLPPEIRQRVLEEVQRLKKGVPLGTIASASRRAS